MIQLRGNNKGCVVVTGDGEEYKFRSGEHEGLREMVKHMNRNLFEEQTHLLEKEYKEAVEWLHEFQEELPRMKGIGSNGEGAAYQPTPPFIVGRKYDDWALGLLDECESSIAYIENTLADPDIDENRKRILRAMRSDLMYTRDILREGTVGWRHPMERRSKEQREVYVDPFEMMDIPQEEEEPDTELLQGLIEELFDMAGLSPREREIFQMKYGEMMTIDEIAEISGTSRGNVAGKLGRAKKKLQSVVRQK
jgi:RNA polymerase sigma factor (sigma-70 family)